MASSFNILLCPLKVGPYALKTTGIGIMTAARQARSVPAHCTPRLSNICVENKGKPAATAERSMMFAATVEAALVQVEVSVDATRKCKRQGTCYHLQRQKGIDKVVKAR